MNIQFYLQFVIKSEMYIKKKKTSKKSIRPIYKWNKVGMLYCSYTI